MIPLQHDLPINPQEYVPAIIDAAVTVVLFIVSFLVIYLLGKSFLTRTVESGFRQRDFDETLVSLALSVTIVFTAIISVALAATVAGFGVVLSAFAILGGALALAVGFATQGLIANFIAGVFIIQDEPFTVGDWIQ